MRSDEMVALIRHQAQLPDAEANPEFSESILLADLNHKQLDLFEEPIVTSQSGYWLKTLEWTTTAGRARNRLPSRSLMGGLYTLEISADGGNSWVPLTEDEPKHSTRSDQGQPSRFSLIGDAVHLYPVPNGAYLMRYRYYLRPPRIVRSQSSLAGGYEVDRGRITAVDPEARLIQVNDLPLDPNFTALVAISSGVQRIDVIASSGWHEVQLVSATTTIAGTDITVGGTEDLSHIQVGDYVRVEDTSDWATLPDEGSRILVHAAAVTALMACDDVEKAQTLAGAASGDFSRFTSLLEPRTRTQHKRVPIKFKCK